jgi:K+-transporting ATPase KdpF subunit
MPLISMPLLLVIAAAVASGLAAYLVVAMLAPERFS